jgi:hypothetical protein
MNVRHVTRVSRPPSRQRAQTNAVNTPPVRSLVHRCSTTLVVATPSRSKHCLQMNGRLVMEKLSQNDWSETFQKIGPDRQPTSVAYRSYIGLSDHLRPVFPLPRPVQTRLVRMEIGPGPTLTVPRPDR